MINSRRLRSGIISASEEAGLIVLTCRDGVWLVSQSEDRQIIKMPTYNFHTSLMYTSVALQLSA